MVQLVVFINLFLVPLLPLYLIYREKQKFLAPNLELLFQYGIVAVCNVPLTKASVFLIRKTAGVFISIDSGYYTLAALLPTVLAFSCCKFYKTYPDHNSWKEKIVQKRIKGVLKDLAPACILLFVGCFMTLVFEPILMYANNMNDFWFDFKIMIWPVLGVFVRFLLVGIAVLLAIYNVDLTVSKRLAVYKGITLIGFIVFFLLYLQGNWLAGNLPVLEGEEIIWEDYGKRENLVMAAAMIIMTVAVIILIRKKGLNCAVSYSAVCASILFVMLFASLIPTVTANKSLGSKDTFTPTLKNFNTISSNRNFLIILVDSADSKRFYDVMMEDEDFSGMMRDFTYYPDTLSVFPYTPYSIPNILTGTVYRSETDYQDYSSGAYNQSPFFEKLSQNDYEMNLYSSSIEWGGKINYTVDNSTSIYDISVNLDDFMRQELRYILFKYLPYGLKQFSGIEELDFNSCKTMDSEYDGYTWGNKVNYKRITENNNLDKQDQNYFHFLHCEGVHVPFNMDKELNTVKGGVENQKISACLTVLKAYLQRLKDNDAYDNSVIVIMSDHGYQSRGEREWSYILERFNPVLFVKGINEKHEMLESDRSVSYIDLQDAFCDLIDGKQSTQLFTDLEPGRVRTVLWYEHADINHEVEYSTTGTAIEPRKFSPTGNVYDLEK